MQCDLLEEEFKFVDSIWRLCLPNNSTLYASASDFTGIYLTPENETFILYTTQQNNKAVLY